MILSQSSNSMKPILHSRPTSLASQANNTDGSEHRGDVFQPSGLDIGTVSKKSLSFNEDMAVLGAAFYGSVGAGFGVIAGAVAGTVAGNSYGHPIVGTIAGICVGGGVGAAVGAIYGVLS